MTFIMLELLLAVAMTFAPPVELRCHVLDRPVTADLTSAPEVRTFCREMLREVHGGFSHEEVAAFVTCVNGRYTFVAWPHNDQPHSGRWCGAFPRGTVAIIHTHPNGMGMPSDIDIRTAQKCGVPVYVITATAISVTSGRGSALLATHWQRA